jgi:hypothetical protein
MFRRLLVIGALAAAVAGPVVGVSTSALTGVSIPDPGSTLGTPDYGTAYARNYTDYQTGSTSRIEMSPMTLGGSFLHDGVRDEGRLVVQQWAAGTEDPPPYPIYSYGVTDSPNVPIAGTIADQPVSGSCTGVADGPNAFLELSCSGSYASGEPFTATLDISGEGPSFYPGQPLSVGPPPPSVGEFVGYFTGTSS